jgi:hypothetical protein
MSVGGWAKNLKHYERSPGLLKALNGVALLIPVQLNAAPQNMPREGKEQGSEPSSWSRRGRLIFAADDRKAALQYIKTRERLEEK